MHKCCRVLKHFNGTESVLSATLRETKSLAISVEMIYSDISMGAVRRNENECGGVKMNAAK